MARRWIQSALAKHHPGSLHRQLGVPAGEVIPVDLLHEAAEHPERFKNNAHAARLLQLRARLALTLRGLREKRRRRR